MDGYFEDARRKALVDHLNECAGEISRLELRALAFGSTSIETMVRRGELERIRRGSYRSPLVPRSPTGATRSAFLACRSAMGVVLTSSAYLQGLYDEPPVRPQLGATPASIGTKRRRSGFDLHPLTHIGDGDLIEHEGLVVTSPLRTSLDLARRVRNAGHRRVAATVLRAATLRDPSVPGQLLERIAGQPRFPGNRMLRDLVDELPGTLVTRSPLEIDFIAFCVEHGLPRPLMNHVVEGFEVDGAYPDARLIVELDTRSYHDDDDSFERDRARDAVLMLAGWRVVRITKMRLMNEPNKVAAQLRALLGMSR